jgi:hypothetical protein
VITAGTGRPVRYQPETVSEACVTRWLRGARLTGRCLGFDLHRYRQRRGRYRHRRRAPGSRVIRPPRSPHCCAAAALPIQGTARRVRERGTERSPPAALPARRAVHGQPQAEWRRPDPRPYRHRRRGCALCHPAHAAGLARRFGSPNRPFSCHVQQQRDGTRRRVAKIEGFSGPLIDSARKGAASLGPPFISSPNLG